MTSEAYDKLYINYELVANGGNLQNNMVLFATRGDPYATSPTNEQLLAQAKKVVKATEERRKP